MEFEIYHYVVAILGGFIAGAINTLAGNGSAITLSILTEVMGLPGNMANGTNRVGVFFQCMASTFAFHKNKKLPLTSSKTYIILMIIGAILGVIVAIRVSSDQFLAVFKFLMIVMLVVILVKPSRWFRQTDFNYQLPLWLAIPVFLALGFYGGFIQMGMGVFFLAAMVLLAKVNLIEANAVKNFIVFIYTLFILFIFQWKGLIDWKIGGIIAIGQASGGYLTAHYASKYPQAEVWAYRLLVIIVLWAILSLFGVIPKL